MVFWLTAAAGLGVAQSGQTPSNQNPPNQNQPSQNQASQKHGQNQDQDIPDAPSAVRPPPPAPPAPPPNQPPPEGSTPAEQPPPFNIKTVPEGGASPDGNTQDLYRIRVPVNAVLVPVRVTDDSGRLVNGLQPKDFTVYEDGKKQALNYFTSDPFALSAAVIFDLGMPDAYVQRVIQTFPALEGAFSQFDQVSVYTYSSSVSKLIGFGAVSKKLDAKLNELKAAGGESNGPAVLGGPLGPQGPTINGEPVDPNVPHVMTPPQESHVLNDAILAAALELGKRERNRRKIIFVISDGRELHSNASYSDVLKVLLSNEIAVYGVALGPGLPGYSKLAKLHLPRMGYTDILPKYASATAGEIFNDASRNAIETSYARLAGDARNQYTLGYSTRAVASDAYRQVEVRVDRPSLKVYAKDGYYPLPPGR